jgi:hypothetical protein
VSLAVEFFDPCDGDFHSLRGLLAALLDDAPFPLSAACDAVCTQTSVGTVVKCDGAKGDAIAVVSVLDITPGPAAASVLLPMLIY